MADIEWWRHLSENKLLLAAVAAVAALLTAMIAGAVSFAVAWVTLQQTRELTEKQGDLQSLDRFTALYFGDGRQELRSEGVETRKGGVPSIRRKNLGRVNARNRRRHAAYTNNRTPSASSRILLSWARSGLMHGNKLAPIRSLRRRSKACRAIRRGLSPGRS